MRSIEPIFNSRGWFIILVALPLLWGSDGCLLNPRISHAQQVVTNITSSGLGTQVPTSPPASGVYDITGGTRAGTNLFHSFGQFSLSRGDVANFINDSGLATNNILGRVTGGNISNIFGTIQTTGFVNASLFLINPAGIVFGPNAVINVSGMAHFTTTDYLRLAELDGSNAGIFHARTELTSMLTSAPVTAFGFLGTNPAAIAVQGSQLTVADGTGISLVGGNITIQSGTPEGGTVQPARLSAPNGKIQLASAASPGEFDAATLQALPNVDGTSFTSFGSVSLLPGSLVDVTGAGNISIRGGSFVLDVSTAQLSTEAVPSPPGGLTQDTIALSRGSTIVTQTSGPETGAEVQLLGRSISLDGASITSVTTGEGLGGNISLSGETITLVNGGQIASRTEGGGTGGAISINANDSVTVSGFTANDGSSGITNPNLFNPETFEPLVASGLYTVSSGSGNGGAVSITAPRVIMENGGTILSATSGDGNGGSISLSGDSIGLTGGSMIISSSGQNLSTFEVGGTGQGGDITLSAAQSILLEGGNLDVFALTTIFSQANNEGSSGNISFSSPEVSIENGAAIATQSFGTGDGGNISVTAPTLLSVTGFNADFGNGSAIGTRTSSGGNGGTIDVIVGTVRVEDGGSIGTNSSGLGSGGDVNIVAAHDIFVQRGGAISTGGFAEGDSGSVSLTAGNTVFLSEPFDPTFPVVIYSNQEGSGAKGNINVTAHDVVLTNGAEILSSSQNQAQGGGAVSVGATGSITVSNGGSIRAFGGSQGNPPITLVAPQIMLDQALVSSRTASSQSGGAITLHATAGDLTLTNNTRVLTSTEQSSGNAGQIVALASGSINLSGNSTMESRSSSVARGDGGSVTLTAGDMVSLSGTGTALSTTTGGRGNGGSVTVEGQSVELHDHASISSNTTGRVTDGGNAGNILIKADTFSLNSGATITASSTGTGAAGTVTIDGTANPAQSVLIDGAGSGIFTETRGTGAGGDIFVNANSVSLQNGGTLSAETSGTDTSAVGGTVTVNAEQMVLSNLALITAETNGVAPAGVVEINTGSLAINSGSQIRSSSGAAVPPVVLALAPPLTGGTVSVQGRTGAGSLADAVSIDGTGSGIFTGTEGVRPGGDLNLSAQSVSISNGALVTAATTGAGTGGAVTINAGNTFASSAGTVSSAASQAQGGDITITAGQSVTLTNGSSVSASSTGPGNAGNILINAGQNYTSTDSAVTTQATAPGTNASGGNITVLATDQVRLTNSQLNASVQGSSTTVGGNIVIDPIYVILQNSQIIAQALQGQGGNISITTNFFLPDSVSIVNASSQFGVNGTVNIQSPLSQLGGKLSPLPKNSLESTTWINSRCRALAGGQASSFVVAGREMLPAEPGGWLGSPVTGLTGEPVFSAHVPSFPQIYMTPSREDTVSLRRMTPPGFLLQAFATDRLADCTS